MNNHHCQQQPSYIQLFRKPTLCFVLLFGIFILKNTQGQIQFTDTTSVATSLQSIFVDSVTNLDSDTITDNNRAVVFDKIPFSITDADNLKLYAAIENWYGKPYRRNGMSMAGVDCSGFVTLIYKEVYHTDMIRTAREMEKDIVPVEKEELKEGDLVFFKIRNNKHTNHIGIYLKDGYFVHASVSRGVVIDHLSQKYWKQYYYKSGRCF